MIRLAFSAKRVFYVKCLRRADGDGRWTHQVLPDCQPCGARIGRAPPREKDADLLDAAAGA